MKYTKWMAAVLVGGAMAQGCAESAGDEPASEVGDAPDLALTSAALTGTGPDLAPVIQGPRSAVPGQTIPYNVMVLNQGSANAAAFTARITATNSAALSVPGGVCTTSGNTRTCTVSSTGLSRGYAYRKAFQVVAKSSPSNVTLSVLVSTANDLVPSNDSYALGVQVSPMPSSLSVAAPANTENLLCGGSQPLTFASCEAAPSSYVSSRFTLHADHTVSLLGSTDPLGSWSQPTPTSLEFAMTDGAGAVQALFQGTMSAPTCFRGTIGYPQRTTPWYGAFQACLMP